MNRLAALAACFIPLVSAPPAAAVHGEPHATRAITDDPRLVRFFDFEDAEAAPVTFPREFVNLADRYGLGRFGRMTLDNAHAASGKWSLRLDSEGTSQIVGLPTGLVPVIPNADYLITVQVRGEGLRRAAVRLSATLHDTHGAPIPGSSHASPVFRPQSEWSTLSVRVPGHAQRAADLTVELQFLQPDRLPRSGGRGGQPEPPDVGAVVWFDALTIRFDARVQLIPQGSLPVFDEGSPARFTAQIRDFSGDTTVSTLNVTDLDGASVHRATLHGVYGGRPFDLTLPVLPAGWYTLTLNVDGTNGPIARRTSTFAVTPRRQRMSGGHRTAPRFMLVHPWRMDEPLTGLARRMRAVTPDETLIEIWHPSMRSADDTAHLDTLREEVEQLSAMDVEIGFILGGLPLELARTTGLDQDDLAGFFSSRNPRHFQSLRQLLIDPTLRTRRWQIGRRTSNDSGRAMPSDAHRRHLADLVSAIHPDPDVRIIRSAFRETTIDSSGEFVILSALIAPERVNELIGRNSGDRSSPRPSILIEHPDPARLSPRDRVIDHAVRTIETWAVEPVELAIESPWRRDVDQEIYQVDPILPLWHGLTDALGGRRFIGRVPAPEGIQILMAQGSDTSDHALIIYADQTYGDALRDPVRLPGARGETTARDLVGGSVALHFRAHDETVGITPRAMPTVIEHIDLRPAQLISKLRIDPQLVPWGRRITEHELVVTNPWPVPIAGTFTFAGNEGIRIDPESVRVSAQAGGTVRVPLSIRVEAGIASGVHMIPVQARIESERQFVLAAKLPVETGWPDINLVTSWRQIRNDRTGEHDLIIRLRITNRSDRTLQLEAGLYPPGMARERRIVGRLAPGASTVRIFRLADGRDALADRSILASVQELNGPGRVNRVLDIPPITESRSASAAPDR